MFKRVINRSKIFKYTPDAVTNSLAAYLYDLSPQAKISPLRLFIYPTALCNDRCVYCSDGLNAEQCVKDTFLHYNSHKDFFADRRYINKLIKDIKKLGIRDLHLFGGGEPFFYKDNMFYFLDSLKNVDVFIRITTNANSLDDGDIERIVRDKLASQINISFNSDSSQTAGRMYLDSARHGHTLEVLNALTRYKRMYGNPAPYVDILITVFSLNYDRMSKVVEFLRGHAIEYCFFQPLRCYTEEQKKLAVASVPEEEIEQVKRKLEELKINSNIDEFSKNNKTGFSSGEQVQRTGDIPRTLVNKRKCQLRCYMPLTTLSICYNGNIPFCQFKYDKQFSSNYFDMDNLSRFIHGKEYLDFTRGFIEGRLSKICKECLFCVNHEMEMFGERFKTFNSKRR